MRARLKICVVSNRHHAPLFTSSLALMMMNCAMLPQVFESVGLCMMPWQSMLPVGRENAVIRAVNDGSTHVLFADDDSVFPLGAAHALMGRWVNRMAMERSGDLHVVGANFCRKQLPLSWTAKGLDGKELSSKGRIGYDEVSRIGFGLTLIPIEVFERVLQPWFLWHHGGTVESEDTVFCRKARELGVRFWVDHDLSLHCKHAGEYLYGPRESPIDEIARIQRDMT